MNKYPHIISYFLLQKTGGIYVGADYEAIKPFNSIFSYDKCYLSANPEDGTKLSDSFIACTADHPFLQYLTEEYSKLFTNYPWSKKIPEITELY
ncbi:MAG: hypothetical protein LUG98_10450, partial [Tannerellaceae bacterium]|nr:hypothetical protein [Tannerellaceae bacterium]